MLLNRPSGYLADGTKISVRDAQGEGFDYLPFGTRIDLDSLIYDQSNRYRFNGKEEQTTGNLGLIDYGARYYDSQLPRWTTIDPLAEKYSSISPYAFCNNNPMNYVDPDGLTPRLYIHGINASSQMLDADVIAPISLARFMLKYSKENSEVIKIDNPQEFIKDLLNALRNEKKD